MPLPMSKNQVRRLGGPLREAPVPSEEDLVQHFLAVEELAERMTRRA